MFAEIMQQAVNGLVIGSVYTLIGLGLSVIFGIFGIAHFAHGSVAMFGGYMAYLFSQQFGMTLMPAMLLALPFGAVLGIAIERLAYRPVRDAPPINAFIVALGLTLIIEQLNITLFGVEQVVIPSRFDSVYTFGGVALTSLRLAIFLGAAFCVALIAVLMKWTKTGSAVRAVALNRDAATLMGIDIDRVSAVVFAVSSALGVAAGAMVGSLLAVAPGMSETLVVKGFAVLILGGLGSIPGVVLGGLILGLGESFAAGFISSAYKDVIAFLIMILVILVKPQGLLGRHT